VGDILEHVLEHASSLSKSGMNQKFSTTMSVTPGFPLLV